MDPVRFDALAKSVASRRSLVGGLLAGVAAGDGGELVSAKRHKKHCHGGEKRCGGKCVDLATDGQHCGACGTFCGQVCCDGRCTDVLRDHGNCGACDVACGANDVCINGRCTPCQAPGTLCPDIDGKGPYCADLSTDRANCGACGHACAYAEVCQPGLGGVSGTCSCPGKPCPAGGSTMCCPRADGVCCDAESGYRCCPAGYRCGGSCGGPCCR